jgi:undecaprenyl-diphosphatase
VKRGFLKQTDFNFTVILQNHVPARFDAWWDMIALPVTPTPSVVVVGLLTIAALVDWKKKKIRLRSLIIPLLFGALVMGELYGKSVVHHPAPPFFMIKNPTTIFPQFYINEQFSYPSGHTSRAVFIGITFFLLVAGPVSDWIKRKQRTLLIGGAIFAYIFAVAIGRIYLGSHWLSDVIGGGLLGLASGLGVVFIL